MIAILRTLTAGAKESWHTTALCFFGISTDLGDGVKISDLNLLIPSTFSFKAGSADLESSSKKQFLQLIGFLHVENPILHFFLCFVLYFEFSYPLADQKIEENKKVHTCMALLYKSYKFVCNLWNTTRFCLVSFWEHLQRHLSQCHSSMSIVPDTLDWGLPEDLSWVFGIDFMS